MVHKTISLFSILLFNGCNGLLLSPEARSVDFYYLKSRISNDCIELGKVEVMGQSLASDTAALSIAIDKSRQKAYDLYHANTLLHTSSGNNFVSVSHSAYAKGIAYSCPQ